MKITEKYRTIGIQEYYQSKIVQDTYENPHQKFVDMCLIDLYYNCFSENTSVLDLACGNGMVSNILKKCGISNIEGADKYMYNRYINETGFLCYPFSFEDIADFNCIFEKQYNVIICSYAFDLVPESYKNKLLYSLSTYTDTLILIRPNSHVVPETIWKEAYKSRFGKSRLVMYKNNIS